MSGLGWVIVFRNLPRLRESGLGERDLGTRKRRLAYYSYNSRDGGYSENTDLLRNRANQHSESDGAVI
jgi:hypothetical protein